MDKRKTYEITIWACRLILPWADGARALETAIMCSDPIAIHVAEDLDQVAAIVDVYEEAPEVVEIVAVGPIPRTYRRTLDGDMRLV